MPGDAGDKTEAPTPRRREEARERGQIARSTDLSGAVLILGALLTLRIFGVEIMAALMQGMRRFLTVDAAAEASRLDVMPLLATVGLLVLTAAGPVLVGVVFIAVVVNLAQVGLLLTGYPLMPKLSKLNPINGVKRLFSTRTLMQALMNLLKLMFVSMIAYVAVKDRLDEIFVAMGVDVWRQILVMSTVLYEVGMQLALVLFLIALLDYGWQRYRHEKDLKMSKQEVKEEMRRMEGDPLIKQRQRKLQFAAALQQIKSAVPKADVVVTNPTELAIAIRYDQKEMSAPKVVAKGQGLLAAKIREIAIANNVPIVQRKPLAQAMFKMVDVGQEVPEQFYKAIAEILAYVYQLSNKKGRRRAVSAA